MIKPFAVLATLLFVMVITMLSHANIFERNTYIETLQHISKLTGVTKLSLSLKYDDTKRNVTYPEMPTLGKMDFVYE